MTERAYVITEPDGELFDGWDGLDTIDRRVIVRAETPGKAKVKYLVATGQKTLSDEFMRLSCRLASSRDLEWYPEVTL